VDYGIVWTLRQIFCQNAKSPIESEITQEVLILAKKTPLGEILLKGSFARQKP